LPGKHSIASSSECESVVNEVLFSLLTPLFSFFLQTCEPEQAESMSRKETLSLRTDLGLQRVASSFYPYIIGADVPNVQLAFSVRMLL
jgi:hypothetical protein